VGCLAVSARQKYFPNLYLAPSMYTVLTKTHWRYLIFAIHSTNTLQKPQYNGLCGKKIG
jgi:hypothetical protein